MKQINSPNTIKYFTYTRKSTEEEERQALSIESQKDKAKEIFGDLEVIDEPFEESKSAFTPYNRPIFSDMIERIKQGEAQGIIAWHPDRLSRNEIDAATITYMLRTGQLKDLKFGSYNFDNSPEGIWMLQMALSQSQYSSAKLSKDVKRGLEKKVKIGWRPGRAPEGYLNDKTKEKGERDIIIDPVRFSLVRQMWDLMLTGAYTPPQILKIANDEWGYRTRSTKRSGNRPLSRSGIYGLFTNPFYAGIIVYNGIETDNGMHTKMITLEEFNHVQMILGRKGKPRPQTHEFAFTGGLIICAECGGFYTAETKTKFLKKEKVLKSYTFYHCTRQKKGITCKQRRCIPVENLESQIEQELKQYTILPEFRDWALEVIRSNNDQEIEDRSKIHENQTKAVLLTQKELDNLTRMRYREQIDDEMFLKESTLLKKKLRELKEQLHDTENRADKWLELTEETFNFATYAHQKFITGSLKDKRQILSNLGSNHLIMDGKLTFQANEWLVPLKNELPTIQTEYFSLEPEKTRTTKAKTEAFAPVRTRLLRDLDSNQGYPR